MTRLLTRSALHALLDAKAVLNLMRSGFTWDSDAEAITGQRIRTDLTGPGTATVLLPGLLPDVDAYTVKVNAKFPDANPALRGIVCLHDMRDGTLLALLDSATVTAWRTGLAAALATDQLAQRTAVRIGFIGAGAQAQLVLRGLTHLRKIEDVALTDSNPAAANRFARHIAEAGTHVRIVATPVDVAAISDIVILATWSRTPLLTLADVRPGQHLTSLGADEPGKQELAADLLTAATLIVDDRVLVSTAGALANAGLPPETAAATLGAVLRGTHPGRSDPDQLTAYTPIGLPWQDLAVAWIAYRHAENHDSGQVIDLLR